MVVRSVFPANSYGRKHYEEVAIMRILGFDNGLEN